MAEVIVTERWSESSLGSTAVDPSRMSPGQPLRIWVGHRGFDVTGVTTKMQALQAPGVPQDNDSHPEEASALVRATNADMTGPISWYVSVDYQTPPGGEWPIGNQPIGAIVSIRWSDAGTMEPFSLDGAWNPIVNSALDPLDPPPSKYMPITALCVVKNEAFYNLTLARQFRNKFNSAATTFMGRYQFAAETLLCTSIMPAADYTPTSTYVPVAYSFLENERGWSYKTVDRGLQAYNSSGVKGPIMLKDPNDSSKRYPASVDQLLNGTGGLYETEDGPGVPRGAIVHNEGNCYSISYRIPTGISFGTLGL